MIITVMSQNLLYGGLRDGNGNPLNRWPELKARIESVQPDLLLMQEAWGWQDFGHKQYVLARNELGMDALPLPPTGSDKNGVAIFYKLETLGRWQRWNIDHAELLAHGFGIASFNIGLAQDLTAMSIHLDAFGADRALLDVEVIANRAYRYGPYAVIGGDFNYSPAVGPDLNYYDIPPYNIQARTVLTAPNDDQPLQPDRRIGWKLARAGLVDVAYHLYQKTRDEKYLLPTAYDPIDRIDRFYVSQPLANAIVDYWIVDTPATASDHKGVAFKLDTTKIEASSDWQRY